MKIGCWEEPKPTDPSLLWPAEWKAPAPLHNIKKKTMIQREVRVSLNDAEFSIYTGSCLHYVDCLLAGWQLLHIISMTINSLLHLTSWCCSAIFLQQYGSLFSSSTSTNSIAARWNHCVFFLLWSVLFGDDQLFVFLDHQLVVFLKEE